MRELEKLTKDQISKVVLDLIGNVNPVGSTHIDEKRLKNLEVLGQVFYYLFETLSNVEYNNRNKVEYSMKHASDTAKKFINDTVCDYFYDKGYRKTDEDLWEK